MNKNINLTSTFLRQMANDLRDNSCSRIFLSFLFLYLISKKRRQMPSSTPPATTTKRSLANKNNNNKCN